jgi:peptidoglycan hydrolase-like protein with peptidoglycan-binding domain
MRLQKALVAAIVVLTAVGLVGCRKEVPPEQRLAQIRYKHDIFPVAAKTMYDAEGNPTLLVDLQVANQGGVPLSMLTVLVKVLNPDGVVKNSERVTLDLEGVQPGIGARVSASLPGVELLDEDEVTVELESNLSPEDLRQLPEFAEISAAN